MIVFQSHCWILSLTAVQSAALCKVLQFGGVFLVFFIWSRQTAAAPLQVFWRCLILRSLPGEQQIDRVIPGAKGRMSDLPYLLCLHWSKCLLNDASAQESHIAQCQKKKEKKRQPPTLRHAPFLVGNHGIVEPKNRWINNRSEQLKYWLPREGWSWAVRSLSCVRCHMSSQHPKKNVAGKNKKDVEFFKRDMFLLKHVVKGLYVWFFF